LVDLLLITIKSARRIKEQTHGGFGKDFDFFCMIVGKTLDHTRLDTIMLGESPVSGDENRPTKIIFLARALRKEITS
jgi:hypothetical protein